MSAFASALNRRQSRRIVRRQPLRSRLFLESLESRVLLDASSGVIGGGLDNLSVNTSLGSTGVVLPVFGSGPHATGLAGLSSSGTASLGAASSSLSQDQPNSQLRTFGVNSQGDDTRLGLSTMASMLSDAYGFGSGVQPNAPWAPAAYNLGLANHQYGYPSQIDNGFSSVAPWQHRTASLQPESDPTDPATQEVHSEVVPDRKSRHEQSQTDEFRLEDKAEDEKTLLEKTATEEAKPELPRDDPAIEQALFADPFLILKTTSTDRSSSRNVHENDTDAVMREDDGIPSSLWVSTVAPAQIAALVVGLPAVEAPAASSEMVPAGEN